MGDIPLPKAEAGAVEELPGLLSGVCSHHPLHAQMRVWVSLPATCWGNLRHSLAGAQLLATHTSSSAMALPGDALSQEGNFLLRDFSLLLPAQLLRPSKTKPIQLAQTGRRERESNCSFKKKENKLPVGNTCADITKALQGVGTGDHPGLSAGLLIPLPQAFIH